MTLMNDSILDTLLVKALKGINKQINKFHKTMLNIFAQWKQYLIEFFHNQLS